MDMRLAPCTCHPYTRTTTLQYGHPTLHQSTFGPIERGQHVVHPPLRSRVQTWEPTMDMRLAPCTCHPYTRTTTLRYRHPTLHQSTFVMPPRSLAGIGPNYQDQLDAPNNGPFPMLKQARKPPMLKYERALGTDDKSTTHDERYHSTLYKERFRLIYYH